MARYDFIDTERLCPVCRGDMPLLSLRITARRQALRLTRIELARRLGIDIHTLARLERGGYRPQRRVLYVVLAWLDLPDSKVILSRRRPSQNTNRRGS